ncbi:hypothetical protein LTR85_001565 [Meristemomyces frigidus]|nr:hypothetical protein LTR85_001565 [Meristemomyces frigidus]
MAQTSPLASMSSRLLNLPPELRNTLYRELLVKHEPHNGCHPHILVTCKQVHNEASALLTSENEVLISISSSIGEWPSEDPEYPDPYKTAGTGLDVHTRVWATGSHEQRLMPMLDLPYGSEEWPAYLRKIERLRLNISLSGQHTLFENLEVPPFPFDDVAGLLFSLTSFFESGHRLRLLGITIDLGDSGLEHAEPIDEGQTGQTALQSTFYPLRRFGRIAETTLTGLPDADCQLFLNTEEPPDLDDEAVVTRLQQQCILRTPLLLRYARIDHEYQAFRTLYEYLDLGPWSDNPQTDYGAVEHSHSLVYRWTRYGIYDEWREQFITLSLDTLREALDKFHTQLDNSVMVTSRRKEYTDLVAVREARRAVFSLDGYEKLELDRE